MKRGEKDVPAAALYSSVPLRWESLLSWISSLPPLTPAQPRMKEQEGSAWTLHTSDESSYLLYCARFFSAGDDDDVNYAMCRAGGILVAI